MSNAMQDDPEIAAQAIREWKNSPNIRAGFGEFQRYHAFLKAQKDGRMGLISNVTGDQRGAPFDPKLPDDSALQARAAHEFTSNPAIRAEFREARRYYGYLKGVQAGVIRTQGVVRDTPVISAATAAKPASAAPVAATLALGHRGGVVAHTTPAPVVRTALAVAPVKAAPVTAAPPIGHRGGVIVDRHPGAQAARKRNRRARPIASVEPPEGYERMVQRAIELMGPYMMASCTRDGFIL